MKNLSQDELNQLRAEAERLYQGSMQEYLDQRWGKEGVSEYTQTMRTNFRKWLGTNIASRKQSVLGELREVKEGYDKAKVLRLMNESFDKYQVLVKLIEDSLN